MNELQPASLQDIPCLIAPLVPKPILRGARFYMPLLRAIGFHLVAPLRIKQAVQFGRRHGVEFIWTELYGDVVVIAQKVAEKLRIPFVATVWDDPEGWLQDFGYDIFSRMLLWNRFDEAVRKASKLATAGEAMQTGYKSKYGVDSVILRHGFENCVTPDENLEKKDDIVIGFVGSPYGKETWMAFLHAVAALNNTGKLPRIRLKTFGGGKFPYSYDGVEIEDRGWQPQDVMITEIAETDFCYLPYWFDLHKRRHVELSFPNKFETYLAATRPILFHGPEYAGINKTIKQYRVGSAIHSLKKNTIIKTLEIFITNQVASAGFKEACISAFHKEFNLDVMLRNFSRMVGTDPSSLSQKIPCSVGRSMTKI
ncbi:MAG: hypothetical protein JRJ85_11360 [Deltaproteobacteria bacterium]|nr:hypothetical protein [Deltaproteobacteria bacterium]